MLEHGEEAVVVVVDTQVTWVVLLQEESPSGKAAVPLCLWRQEAERPRGEAAVVHQPEVYSTIPSAFSLTKKSAAPAWSANASTARTPMWRQDAINSNGGGRTPAYNAGGGGGGGDGSRTVNPYADGSRTVNPYGGSTSYGGASAGGSRTPAWNPTATSSSYTHDPFSSRTPAHEPSYVRTPAPSYPTPQDSRPYDAPTPGKDFTTAPPRAAHPRNGFAGSRRGALGGAPTPKFRGDAPTPFSGQPETPGWRGEVDDEPRYEEGTPSP